MFIKSVKAIINALNQYQVVCIPTDTLFALACDATNHEVIEKLYSIKNRSQDKKTPILFSSISHVMEHCILSELEMFLAKKFWPGKLTIVLTLKNSSNIAMNNSNTIAARVCSYFQTNKIIKNFNRPIIGTSANIANCNDLYDIYSIKKTFNTSKILILKSKKKVCHMPSTIVKVENEKIIILREGAIKKSLLYLNTII